MFLKWGENKKETLEPIVHMYRIKCFECRIELKKKNTHLTSEASVLTNINLYLNQTYIIAGSE